MCVFLKFCKQITKTIKLNTERHTERHTNIIKTVGGRKKTNKIKKEKRPSKAIMKNIREEGLIKDLKTNK